MSQPDFFNLETKEEKESLEQQFARERLEWNNKIKELSSHLKNIQSIPELMINIYTERQTASEYYHYLLSMLVKLNKEYRREYDGKWNFYTYKTDIRYPNEQSKTNRIQVDLENMVIKREMINNHAKYIEATVKTIDNIIYGVQARIKVEDINRGK
jgi:uncharacterized coiled-coil DUF342 family protein